MASWIDKFEQRQLAEVPRPPHELGDAQHFPEGLTNEWQLRPLTTHDMQEGVAYAPGTWVLARQFPNLGRLYFPIRLPWKLRRNCASNVAEAYRRASTIRPDWHLFVLEMEKLADEIMATDRAAAH